MISIDLQCLQILPELHEDSVNIAVDGEMVPTWGYCSMCPYLPHPADAISGPLSVLHLLHASLQFLVLLQYLALHKILL